MVLMSNRDFFAFVPLLHYSVIYVGNSSHFLDERLEKIVIGLQVR